MAFRSAGEQHPACLYIRGFVATLQPWRALFTYLTCFLVQNTKPNYRVKAIMALLLHPFPSPSPIAWFSSIWAFLTVLGRLAVLQAGLFAVAQGNHGKAGEATCQGAGRRRPGGGGMRNAENPFAHEQSKTCQCIYAKIILPWMERDPRQTTRMGCRGSYPTLMAGHALHPKACEQQQQTGRVAGWGARAEEGGSPFRAVHGNELSGGPAARLAGARRVQAVLCWCL